MLKFKIETVTNEEIEQIAEEIFKADNGYGKYTPEEITTSLFSLGLTDKNGVFLTNLTGRKKEIVDKIIYMIS